MKLILACSADGYLARGPKDDMAWTGGQDKVAFKLLTQVGGICYASASTWEQLPELPGRTILPVGRTQRPAVKLPKVGPIGIYGNVACYETASIEEVTTLGKAFHAHPYAWLLGGPMVALEALQLGMVDQVFMSNVPVQLFERNPAFSCPGIKDKITPWLASRGEKQNAGVPWRRDQRIRLSDGTTVDCWSRLDVTR